MFERYHYYLSEQEGDVMEETPVDYSQLDQITKAKLAADQNLSEAIVAETKRRTAVDEAEEMKRADRLAELISEFSQNEKGETLANVHTCQGFQEVYDYKGYYLERFNLERRKEMAANMQSNLFQKVYYAKDLLLEDERTLRTAFNSAKDTYETSLTAAQGAMFLGFWPIAYRLSLQVKPATLLLFSGAYYFGLYKQVVEPFALSRLQASINGAASQFAEKYGVHA
jgi:hypothetical protein